LINIRVKANWFGGFPREIFLMFNVLMCCVPLSCV